MTDKKAVKKDPEFKSLAWCKAFAECDLKIQLKKGKMSAKEQEDYLEERLVAVKKMYGLR